MSVALYPGSFDPITTGHVDIIHRALAIFDQVEIGVATNIRKSSTFSTEERISMIRETFATEPRVVVTAFSGLLVDYAVEKGIKTVIRGLRAVSDFEYEFQMASMNRRLTDQVDFMFLMTSEEHFFVSSSLVREVALNGGDVSRFVPAPVQERLITRLKSE
jgi:pantetheine-phosphate adenylyltransferase